MSTIYGNGQGIDFSFKASAQLKTTTSQFRVVGLSGTTTNADFTVYLADNGSALDDTMTAYNALGVNQTYMSASATECTVRMIGISKALCATTVVAGDYIVAYDGISTTTYAGAIESLQHQNADAGTVGSYGMSAASFQTVLGRAMEDGAAGEYITVFLNPQLYDRNFWKLGA